MGGGGGGGRPLLGGKERAGGRRGAEAARRGKLGLEEAAGADPVRAPPPGGPTDADPWIRGRTRVAALWLPWGSESLERLKLGSRDAQPIRKGGGGKPGRGWEPLFPPSPKSAPAGQAGPLPGRPGWWVGRKHRPSGGGNRELSFLTLAPHLPKIPPRRRLLPCAAPISRKLCSGHG